MRVLHVIPSYARSDGGPSEIIRELLPALAKEGVEVRLVTTDKGAENEQCSWSGASVAQSRPPRAWSYARGLRALVSEAVAWSDLVHVHSVHTYPSTLAMAESRRRTRPYLLEPHGALDEYHLKQGIVKKRAYMATVDRQNLRYLSGLVVSSDRESTEASRVVRHTALWTVPLGVDSRLFQLRRPSRQTEGDPRMLFLGRLTQKKRLDRLLEALATPPLSDLRPHLIVAGPREARLRYDPARVVEELGLSDQVELLGLVGREQRAQLLASSDLFVLPSENESFGVAVAEAMASGCPAAATREVGLAPAAAEAGALSLVTLEARVLSRQLAAMLSVQNRLQELSVAGRQYAQRHFEWSSVAKALLAVYDRTLWQSRAWAA